MNKQLSKNELYQMFGYHPVEQSPMQVIVRSGSRDDFEEAFKRFKSMVQRERVVSDFKEREFYQKPSEKKRKKKRLAFERKLATESMQKQMANGEWDKKQKRKQEKRDEREQKRKNDVQNY